MKIRIAKSSGFGRSQPVELDKNRVILGSAPHCDVRFDATWDRTVAREHAELNCDGRQWVIRDLGSASGTIVNGQRISQPTLVDHPAQIELGQGGPRLHVEPVGTATSSAPPPASAAPTFTTAPRPSGAPSSANVAKILAGAFVLLVALGVGVWFWKNHGGTDRSASSQTPLPPALNSEPQPQVPEPAQPQPIPPAPQPSHPTPSPAPITASDEPPPLPSIVQNYPPKLQQSLERIRKSGTTRGLSKFLIQTNTQSPYTRSLLQNAAGWYDKMTPWLAKRLANESFEMPGIYIGELFGAPYALPNTPAAPGPLVSSISPALFPPGHLPPDAQIASTQSVAARTFSIPAAAKGNLSAKFNEFSKRGGDAPGVAWGVFVGISDFEQINDLFGCRNDVVAISKILMTQGILEPQRVRLLTDARKGTKDYATKANVVAALRETVAAAGPNDTIFIWFSTHGCFVEGRKDSLLVMVDSTDSDPNSFLFGSELQSILGGVKSRSMLMVMDACQTGGMGAIGGAQFSATKDAAGTQRSPIPDSFYEMLGSARGHVVIRACRSDQSTPDLPFLGHGLLTTVMIAGLTGDADVNHDGIVTLSELRIFVTTAIPQICRNAAEFGEDQSENGGPLQPTFTSSSFGEAGDLPLTLVANPNE